MIVDCSILEMTMIHVESLYLLYCFRLFGFPDHYTDVGNIAPTKRQKILAKSWSVPVVQHILRPLTQFFTCVKNKKSVLNNGQIIKF